LGDARQQQRVLYKAKKAILDNIEMRCLSGVRVLLGHAASGTDIGNMFFHSVPLSVPILDVAPMTTYTQLTIICDVMQHGVRPTSVLWVVITG